MINTLKIKLVDGASYLLGSSSKKKKMQKLEPIEFLKF